MGLVIVGPFEYEYEYEYRLAPEYEYDSRPKPRNQYRIITPLGFSPKPAAARQDAEVIFEPSLTLGRRLSRDRLGAGLPATELRGSFGEFGIGRHGHYSPMDSVEETTRTPARL